MLWLLLPRMLPAQLPLQQQLLLLLPALLRQLQ
jgi:hypothetical protein